jgi:hypothetical protein
MGNHFAIYAKSPEHRIATNAQPLCNALQSMHNRFAVAAQSKRNRFALATHSLYAVAAQSLYNRYAINAQSFHNRIAIGVCDPSQSIYNQRGIAAQAMRRQCAINAQLLRIGFAVRNIIAAQSLCTTASLSHCKHHEIGTEYIGNLRNLCAIASASHRNQRTTTVQCFAIDAQSMRNRCAVAVQ